MIQTGSSLFTYDLPHTLPMNVSPVVLTAVTLSLAVSTPVSFLLTLDRVRRPVRPTVEGVGDATSGSPARDGRHGRRTRAMLGFVTQGGPRTLVFTCLSFGLWVVSVGLVGTTMAPRLSLPQDDSMLRAELGAYAGLLSFAFMVNAILVFEPSTAGCSRIVEGGGTTNQQGREGGKGREDREDIKGGLDVEWDTGRLPSKSTSSGIAVVEGLGFAVGGLGLVRAAQDDEGRAVVYTACAVASFFVSSMVIYGLGGLLRHSIEWRGIGRSVGESLSGAVKTYVHERMNSREIVGLKGLEGLEGLEGLDEKTQMAYYSSALSTTGSGSGSGKDEVGRYALRVAATEWRFWQAFRGGTMFIAMQAAGWVLFSVAMVPLIWSVGLAMTGAMHGLHWVQSYTTHAGVAAVMGVVVIACSLLVFNNSRDHSKLKVAKTRGGTSSGWWSAALVRHLEHVACVCILYIPAHVTLAAIVATFVVFGWRVAMVAWAVMLPVYYSLTGLGRAEKDGSREWPEFRDWLGRTCAWVLPRWFSGVEVVLEGDGSDGSDGDRDASSASPFDPDQRYVFGYVPHGLYPLGAAYLPLLPAWRRLVGPKIRPPTLGASINHVLPVLRDLLQWLGLRVVSKQTFIRTLEQRNSLIVVPGGQAELVLTSRLGQREAAFYAGHKGFIRLALQQGAKVCPIICFGEATSLTNFVDTPKLHQWSYKKFGFPIPFLATGRWWISPFPKAGQGLKFVIGRPIEPSGGLGLVPTEQQVEEYHAKFYAAAKRLFDQHKGSFGWEDVEVVVVESNKQMTKR